MDLIARNITQITMHPHVAYYRRKQSLVSRRLSSVVKCLQSNYSPTLADVHVDTSNNTYV